MTHSYRKMLIYRRRREEGLIQTDGWMEPLKLLLLYREELISFVQRPHSLSLPYSPNNSSLPPYLPICFVFFLSPRDVYTFFPSTCLAAGCLRGEMEGNRGGGFQNAHSFREGWVRGCRGGLQSCSGQ